MALVREVVGALSHAELVDLVVRQSVLIDQLQATIAQQQALITQLEARVRDLEQQLAQRDKDDPTKRMPGLKLATTPRHRKSGPRKHRPHGFSRPRSPAPTEVVTHAAAQCPHCQTLLIGAPERERWRKEVLDLPPVQPARVIHHLYLERTCPGCGRRVAPPRATPTELGVLAGRQRLGTELLAHLAVWRTEFRLPIPVLAWALGAFHHLELSEGAIVGALRRVAQAGQPRVEQTLAAIRASPVVHADETGLREDGRNGSLWSFSTPTQRSYCHGRRDKSVVDAVLGPDFAGVLCTDFSVAYDHSAGPHQRCWRHLLADVHELVERHPSDAGVKAWADQVHAVSTRAARFVAQAEPRAAVREREQRACEAALLAVCAEHLAADKTVVPQAVLCRRVAKYLPEVFTFVAEPRVDSTNNAAERSVRGVVVQRTISGGTRSAAGTSTFTTLQTLFGTWRAQGLNPLIACRQMLATTAAASA